MTLTVGVTGHRLERLGPAGVEAVSGVAGQLLRMVEAAIPEGYGAADEVKIRLVTAVAEGADTIFAEAALKAGWPLDVVLPFARDAYLDDFPVGGPRETFDGLLSASRAIFELESPAATEETQGEAYERAGRIVLSQCDLLIAVWDGKPAHGRGGAAQIVAAAALEGIPIIHVDPTAQGSARLLWDGLQDHDLGQQTIETVPQGSLDAVPGLVESLLAPPDASSEKTMLGWFQAGARHRRLIAFAFPLLLLLIGVGRLRPTRSVAADTNDTTIARLCGEEAGGLAARVRQILDPRFARADTAASYFAQLFRSAYVLNFFLAALAVLLTLSGLLLPYSAKPVLVALEFLAIASILLIIRAGRRGAWHRRWLDCRQLAERLRCLVVSAQLGELGLRRVGGGGNWIQYYVRATAQELGLPSIKADFSYLTCCRTSLLALLDDQIGYLQRDAACMRQLEHRLHVVGTALFAATALTCLSLFLLEITQHVEPWLFPEARIKPVLLAATIASAGLPALGAAIYGIRMQGEFAGGAARSEALAKRLVSLRVVMIDDPLDFDTLRRRSLRATDLLTSGLGSWLETYSARPLSLPG